MTAASIRVGTSGYSFKDWVGTVYPRGMRPADFLIHYASLFDAVEINSTYYRIPPPRMFVGMLRKVPRDFLFAVKLPKEMTHERAAFNEAVSPFLAAIAPLVRAGQMGGLLAQFPYAFRCDPAAWEHLERLAAAFLPRGLPLNVEFRHTGWSEPHVEARLRELGLGAVNVDLPRLPKLPRPSNVVTSPIAYYRLHGRNAQTWWRHPTPSHRYDYLYTETELEAWAQRAEQAAGKARIAFIFNNNCHLGQSVVNALQLHQRLHLPTPTLPPGLAPELIEHPREALIDDLRRRIRDVRDAEPAPPIGGG